MLLESGFVYILIVEDEKELVESMKALLEAKGYSVEIASNGKEAEERIQNRNYDIAIIDLFLPDVSGIELLKKFDPRQFPRTRKIILTGHASLEIAIQALNFGADAYITKPVSPEDLLKIISEQLEKQNQEIVMVQEKVMMLVERTLKEGLKKIKYEKYI
ncbi:MAG: response regulator [Candidatus Methanomethyliaceae archaeon]|nr:response regulator [Candidatus Methanomethyliaceae archaeon]